MNKYEITKLSFELGDLAPVLSEEQVTIHYQKHHQSYVNNANKLLEKISETRKSNAPLEMKSFLKDFSFQSAGHYLHDIFWNSLTPKPKELNGKLKDQIINDFGSFENFKKEFSEAALNVEGSGWATLSWCPKTSQFIIQQIEKHNLNHCPNMPVIIALDVFEHAYYIDYKNDRAKYIESMWQIFDWESIEKRFEVLLQ